MGEPFSELVQLLYGDDVAANPDCVFSDAANEIRRLRQWVADLQDGMYVNCIYCGHRYPPGIPESRDKALFEHIKTCPKHPLSKALQRIKELEDKCKNS